MKQEFSRRKNIRKLLKQIHPTWKYVLSPLLRVVQTAQIIAPDTPITTDERLLEMDYGLYEGANLENPPPELTVFFKDFVHNPAPSGIGNADTWLKEREDFSKK